MSVTGGSVERDGEQVRIEAGSGNTLVAGGNVKLPDGFPDDVPQPSTTLAMAMKMPQGFTVGFQCAGSQSEEFEKLQQAFQAEGWEETMAMQSPNGSVLGFKKGDSRNVQASVGKNKKGTVVSLTITQL